MLNLASAYTHGQGVKRDANEEREGLEHISLDEKSGPASPEEQH